MGRQERESANHLLLGYSFRCRLHAPGLQREQTRRPHPGSAKDLEQAHQGVAGMNGKDFNNLVESIKEAGKIKAGELPPIRRFEFSPLDIKTIREQLHKSQSEFALMIGVSVSTLQNWEQGRRKPEGPAKALLKVASKNPKAVMDALSS
jgi:putative transcriptional regulator